MKALHLTAAALGAAAVLLLAGADTALAAKHAVPTWKVWWDWSWKIVNFLILAFLIVKMAKKPLKEFLTGQRAKVAAELEEVNKAKAEAEAQLKAIEAKTSGLAQELKSYEQALADMVDNERKRLMDDAREESELLMKRAELQAGMALHQAKRDLANDIVALAAQLAEEKLKGAVSSADQERFFQKFADGALSARGGAV